MKPRPGSPTPTYRDVRLDPADPGRGDADLRHRRPAGAAPVAQELKLRERANAIMTDMHAPLTRREQSALHQIRVEALG